eukprot:12513084-Alexandrium_andersonii.AAC.1
MFDSCAPSAGAGTPRITSPRARSRCRLLHPRGSPESLPTLRGRIHKSCRGRVTAGSPEPP